MNDLETTQMVLDWSTTFLRRSMHDLNRFARGAGLSFSQMNVLMHLFYGGPREVMAFGELMQVSPAGASQMIERLVQGGLVQRVEPPGDRRVRIVHLTGRGREVVEESIAAQQRWVEQLVAALTGEQRAAIGGALRVLAEHATIWEEK